MPTLHAVCRHGRRKERASPGASLERTQGSALGTGETDRASYSHPANPARVHPGRIPKPVGSLAGFFSC